MLQCFPRNSWFWFGQWLSIACALCSEYEIGACKANCMPVCIGIKWFVYQYIFEANCMPVCLGMKWLLDFIYCISSFWSFNNCICMESFGHLKCLWRAYVLLSYWYFEPLADGVERFHAALKLLVSNRTRESYSWQFSFIFWSAVINDSLNEYSFTKQALYKSETGKLA